MRRLILSIIAIAGLCSTSGCVVYERPCYSGYAVYDGPSVVYVHGGYYGGGYYHHGYYR